VPKPTFVQLDKVGHKSFTVICSKGKPVTGSMIISRANCPYGEMKITENAHSLRGETKKLPQRT